MDARLRNKWWRVNNLYKIKNKAGELVTFKPNPIQLQYWASRGAHKRNLIVKARQFGFTTDACIDHLDEALWVPGMSCAIIADTRENSDQIFQIVKRAFDNLPEILKPRVKTDTVRMYRFTHRFDSLPLDSSVYVALRLRSGTVQKLHISEAAYIKDRAELVAGSKQTVPKDGWITEETTGNGYEDFYDLYMEYYHKSNIGPMDYKTHFFAWFENPEYTLPGVLDDSEKTSEELELQSTHKLTDGQLIWRRWKKNELKVQSIGEGLTADQLFKQEYPSTVAEAFQSGVGNVFDGEKLDSLGPTIPLKKVDEKAQPLQTKGVKFWKLAEPGKEYVIGVDPSDGDGSDFSSIDVWDDKETEQVAQYYGKLRPDELSELTKEIAVYYNRAFVGVENNLLTTVLFLSKIYDNYYFEVKQDEKTLKRTKKLGWNTNIKSRDIMIDEFNILFDEGHLKIKSAITLGEMRTFVKKPNGKREHADGKHDDALFAAMIAMQIRKLKPRRAKAFATKPF